MFDIGRHGLALAVVAFSSAAAILASTSYAVAFGVDRQPTLLEERVRTALLEKGPALSDVKAEVNDGVVELAGFVDSLAAKDAAVGAVSMVPSVNGVVDRIEVHRGSRSASEVERDYREILRNDPATESFEFDVDGIDQGGVLTLGGTVHFAAEKHLAEMAARRVRGVQEVVNGIQLESTANRRPDSEIEEEIRTLFKWDNRVNASVVAVSVRNGVVRLTGVARSPREKIQAILLSYVDGVKKVDATDLPVAPSAASASETPVPVSDQEISSAIQHVFTVDPRVPEESLSVRVEGGVARIEGRVGRLLTEQIAEEDARNVLGVVGVSSAIEVVPTDDLTPAQIEKNVRTLLGYDPLIGREHLDVVVDRGVVTVAGAVGSALERDRIMAAASAARGVLEVKSKLVVAPKQS